jgi:hypothetical protein
MAKQLFAVQLFVRDWRGQPEFARLASGRPGKPAREEAGQIF